MFSGIALFLYFIVFFFIFINIDGLFSHYGLLHVYFNGCFIHYSRYALLFRLFLIIWLLIVLNIDSVIAVLFYFHWSFNAYFNIKISISKITCKYKDCIRFGLLPIYLYSINLIHCLYPLFFILIYRLAYAIMVIISSFPLSYEYYVLD